MVHLWIDNVKVQMPENASVLDAARKIGIDVPALCHLADHAPNTSCMCCLVRVDGAEHFVPACATRVREGMRVESETREVHALRRTGIELLLADHAGDCRAPCQNTCPAKMDIPNMLRLVADGKYAEALAVVKRDIALPAILGRVCPEVCEQACRRGQHDSPAAICKIKRFVADYDLASAQPFTPVIGAASGKRVVVVGAGPTGLTAVYHLRQWGHRCTLIEAADAPGGRLLGDFGHVLSADVLRAEANAVLSLDIECHFNETVDADAIKRLLKEYDAVVIATGRRDMDWTSAGIETTKSGIRVDAATRMSSRQGAFAAGNAVRPYALAVQSVAEGKLVAECVDHWLRGAPPPDRRRAYETRLARLTNQEMCDFCEGTLPTLDVYRPLLDTNASEEAAQREAERCLECDCSALAECLLHHYAAQYDCDAQHYRGEGRRYEGRLVGTTVTLEHGKCILCGICVQLAAEARDAAGLAFVNRGLETRIAPPLGASIDQALGSSAQRCAEACPTGAITLHHAPCHSTEGIS